MCDIKVIGKIELPDNAQTMNLKPKVKRCAHCRWTEVMEEGEICPVCVDEIDFHDRRNLSNRL